MSRYDSRARSGPHSVHDARQHAWSLLIFGPGAPAPRQRIHPGLLPDVYIAPARRGLVLARLVAFFRRKAEEGAADWDDDHERQGESDGTAFAPNGKPKRNTDRLAA